ncbi:M16 family metallopeptidase [Microbispora sp. CA-135349]|uniref:M16 family metallopeptidase n=1 Tax=Microbispora sp. CA-135349 TaxID=3239953 RepID=UPI003D8B797A
MSTGLADRVLPAGPRVLALRRGVTPMAEVRLHVPASARTPHALAVTALLAACVSARHSDKGEAVDLTVSADFRQVAVSGSCPVEHLDALLRTLAAVVTDPAVQEDELSWERRQLAARLRVLRSYPEVEVAAALHRHLFPGHPVTYQVAEEEELHRVSAAEVNALPAGAFDPRRATLVVVAATDPEHAADLAEKALSGWRPAEPAGVPVGVPDMPAIAGGRMAVLPRPDAPQSLIRLRAQAVATDDPRYPALFLASNVLGGYLSSRLSRNLREEKGYVYGVSSFFDAYPGTAYLGIDADTAAATTGAAHAELTSELERMRAEPPTDAEIAAARTYALGSMATRLAPRAALASALADLAACDVDPLWLLDFPHRLRAVSPRQVVEAADEFFAPRRFSGLVAADPGALVHPLTFDTVPTPWS